MSKVDRLQENNKQLQNRVRKLETACVHKEPKDETYAIEEEYVEKLTDKLEKNEIVRNHGILKSENKYFNILVIL